MVIGQRPTVLAVDQSLNELQLFRPAEIDLGDSVSVKAFSLPDLIGEKYRAMLQQEIRGRTRGLNAYDLHQLLINPTLAIENDEPLRQQVLLSLASKSAARNIEAQVTSMRAQTLINRLEKSHNNLEKSVESLTQFQPLYRRIAQYYENLPWNDIGATGE